ncbi:MAG: polysaccharide biosynthesis tyrosine autokinase [Desulfobacteraceae bacterium]|jgi:exopolysaccharide/PEP-CTERM locus tyrosine autokinase
MGKISDALERQKKERAIQAESLRTERPEQGEVPVPPKEPKRSKGPSAPAPPVSKEDVNQLRMEDPELSRIQRVAGNRKFSPKLIVVSAPESVDAENFKALRAGIQLTAEKHNPPRTILVTSTYPGEGKSFVACNLAASIAFGIDEHVLLVDCDLRRPQVHEYFGYVRSQGLADYLSERREIHELLINTDIPKLSILTAGTPLSNPAELVSSNKMEALIEEVRNRYDDRYVILDATPTQFTSEAAVLSRHVDGVLLVVMAQRSPRQAVQNGLRNLEKGRILGVVFNGYSEPLKSYRKYYSGYYHN